MVKVIVLGNDVDTDVIAPGGYLHLPLERQTEHCMEAIYPNFSNVVREGDLIVAGANFGTGSSREQAPALLKKLGIGMVLAESFSRLFFRNAVNVGLLPCLYSEKNYFDDLEEVIINMKLKTIENGHKVLKFTMPTGIPMEIIEAGGMISYARSIIKRKNY